MFGDPASPSLISHIICKCKKKVWNDKLQTINSPKEERTICKKNEERLSLFILYTSLMFDCFTTTVFCVFKKN